VVLAYHVFISSIIFTFQIYRIYFAVEVFRRIFGSKRDEVTKEWIKLNNEELNDLYCSPNIVRVIKSR